MCPSSATMPRGTTSPPPSTSRSDHSHDGAASEASTEAPSEGSRSSSIRTRRRTKTGCLTCRKRRIKCGEERPICANCIKSRRSCEGYARPLTFRDPVAIGSTWNSRGMQQSHAHLQSQSAGSQPYMAQSASAAQTQFPVIAPRPPQPTYVHEQGTLMWSPTPSHEQVIYYNPPGSGGPVTAPFPVGFPYSASPPQSSMDMMHGESPMRPATTWPSVAAAEDSMSQQPPLSAGPVLASSHAYVTDMFRFDGARSAPPIPLEDPQPTPTYSAASMSPVVMARATDPIPNTGFEIATTYPSAAPTPPQDYYGTVDAEDSVPVPAGTAAQLPRHDYGLMLALAASREDQGIRSYDAFLEDTGILATYVPNHSASPLMENITARIFCHFITATAPFLSIFERHPVSPYAVFTGHEIPRAQQAVWTYVLPMMALNNQTLLQAMLALASMQIARLQNHPPTASLRHYHFALRKIARAVDSPTKRTAIPTLAATLLLGHYEATTAEHVKWSSHLAGAQQLLQEVDLVRPARQIRHLRLRKGNRPWSAPYVNIQFQQPSSDLPWVPAADSTDEQLLVQLTGAPLPYGTDEEDIANATPPTDKDIEEFQIYRDLFWFYVKQDIIQSCISGNALLLCYDSWIQCLPRGPINKIDHAYGTMDHMLLLMGRVCNFAHKDQTRKIRAEASEKGKQAHSYGLIPGVFSSNMPDAFRNPGQDSEHPTPPVPLTAGDELAIAENDWNAIQSAFTVFERNLGSAFAPVPSDAAPPMDTPFGAAIHFRTHQIAAIWSFYYTARIIALRTHPTMPASPAVAAELVASKTAAWSTAIARIALGMQPPPVELPLNPSFGAALSESMVPLFFAGIEYKDTAQRTATIDRLLLIADRAGLESARLVAQGLEQQWEQQAERGVGPPYTCRVVEVSQGILGREDIEGAMLETRTSDLEHGGGALMSSSDGPSLDPSAGYLPGVNPNMDLGIGGRKSWSKGMLGDDDQSPPWGYGA